MSELLDIALEAHGGLVRWSRVNSIRVHASITGAIWLVKGKPDVLKEVVITAEVKRERVTMELAGKNKCMIFEPDRVEIRTAQGGLITAQDDPEKSFDGQTLQTPWNDVHVAYFTGEAMWTYLNIPFLYAQPGFETEEIASIQSDGETWRRLRATFPENITSHTRTQISCFGPDGLLRRQDYTVDILGGSQGLNYASDYRCVDGIVFPVTRRVIAYVGNYKPVKDPVLVAIDMAEITLNQ